MCGHKIFSRSITLLKFISLKTQSIATLTFKYSPFSCTSRSSPHCTSVHSKTYKIRLRVSPIPYQVHLVIHSFLDKMQNEFCWITLVHCNKCICRRNHWAYNFIPSLQNGNKMLIIFNTFLLGLINTRRKLSVKHLHVLSIWQSNLHVIMRAWLCNQMISGCHFIWSSFPRSSYLYV